MRVINPHFTTVRDNNVKQNLIRAVELIGRAVQPNHLQSENYVFTRRTDLLKHMEVRKQMLHLLFLSCLSPLFCLNIYVKIIF